MAEGRGLLTDRTVHAWYEGMEIVRYDRAGKWYLEPIDPRLARQHVGVHQAARSALWGVENARGVIYRGAPGGATFDRLVRKLA